MEIKKEYVIGGLAVLGTIGIITYLNKPKKNSEGFFNASGKILLASKKLPIPTKTNEFLVLKDKINSEIAQNQQELKRKNLDINKLFNMLNSIRESIENFYLGVLFYEADDSGTYESFNYLLLGIKGQTMPPSKGFTDWNGGLYGSLKLINDAKRGYPFDKNRHLVFLKNLQFLFNEGLFRSASIDYEQINLTNKAN